MSLEKINKFAIAMREDDYEVTGITLSHRSFERLNTDLSALRNPELFYYRYPEIFDSLEFNSSVGPIVIRSDKNERIKDIRNRIKKLESQLKDLEWKKNF